MKKKTRYCYLAFWLFISFFGDIFSPKWLTAARAMLHWTRTKGKNRGDCYISYIYFIFFIKQSRFAWQSILSYESAQKLSAICNTYLFVGKYGFLNILSHFVWQNNAKTTQTLSVQNFLAYTIFIL